MANDDLLLDSKRSKSIERTEIELPQEGSSATKKVLICLAKESKEEEKDYCPLDTTQKFWVPHHQHALIWISFSWLMVGLTEDC